MNDLFDITEEDRQSRMIVGKRKTWEQEYILYGDDDVEICKGTMLVTYQPDSNIIYSVNRSITCKSRYNTTIRRLTFPGMYAEVTGLPYDNLIVTRMGGESIRVGDKITLTFDSAVAKF